MDQWNISIVYGEENLSAGVDRDSLFLKLQAASGSPAQHIYIHLYMSIFAPFKTTLLGR